MELSLALCGTSPCVFSKLNLVTVTYVIYSLTLDVNYPQRSFLYPIFSFVVNFLMAIRHPRLFLHLPRFSRSVCMNEIDYVRYESAWETVNKCGFETSN